MSLVHAINKPIYYLEPIGQVREHKGYCDRIEFRAVSKDRKPIWKPPMQITVLQLKDM